MLEEDKAANISNQFKNHSGDLMCFNFDGIEYHIFRTYGVCTIHLAIDYLMKVKESLVLFLKQDANTNLHHHKSIRVITISSKILKL